MMQTRLVCQLGCIVGIVLASLVLVIYSDAAEPAAVAQQIRSPAETAAQRGYRLLRTKPFLDVDFSQAVFEDLWTTWPAELRKQAETATPAERRKLTFDYYGLIEPNDGLGKTALGYVDNGRGGWVMNCLACHGGQVDGKVIPGLPNSTFGLASLTQDVAAVKVKRKEKLGRMELGSLLIPLGGSAGTTNAVVFGVALASFRDRDLNVDTNRPLQKLVHHDLDAPPFWHLKRKSHLYYDGFVPKHHRALLQFVLIKENDAARLKSWEGDFQDILAWIESLEPPKYPGPINRELANQGLVAFTQHCSQCHGTYGANSKYPEKLVPLADIGTDPVRLNSISTAHRKEFGQSWFGSYGERPCVEDPAGYIAPPLDGIWASAPYLHNGSVPTLWHMLHPADRPTVWKRTLTGYDHEHVGLQLETVTEVPPGLHPAERRRYFDTRLKSKSSAGHTFPDALTEAEKRAVLEYLKTL